MDRHGSWGALLIAPLLIGALTMAPRAAHAALVGTSDDFSGDAIGTFPTGWLDVATVNPASPAPKPSALVVGTTDAHGNPIHALATLPAIAPSQGIYRAVPLSSTYSSKADVRVDRFSDFATGTNPTTDWAMAVGINQLQGTTDPAFIPSIQIYASAITHSWRLFAATTDVSADLDLGVPVTLGTWYGVQVDLNALTGSVHSSIIDAATGVSLADVTTALTSFGSWIPSVDGAFDIEGFFDGELTATTTSNLAIVTNIDQVNTPLPEPASLGLLALAMTLTGAAVRRAR